MSINNQEFICKYFIILCTPNYNISTTTLATQNNLIFYTQIIKEKS